MDLEGGLPKGKDLADKILAMGHPQIEWVVLGQAQSPDPVVEVILKKSNQRDRTSISGVLDA
jgi:hypothetical protein